MKILIPVSRCKRDSSLSPSSPLYLSLDQKKPLGTCNLRYVDFPAGCFSNFQKKLPQARVNGPRNVNSSLSPNLPSRFSNSPEILLPLRIGDKSSLKLEIRCPLSTREKQQRVSIFLEGCVRFRWNNSENGASNYFLSRLWKSSRDDFWPW